MKKQLLTKEEIKLLEKYASKKVEPIILEDKKPVEEVEIIGVDDIIDEIWDII